MKKCIDKRPYEPPGYCLEVSETKECRDDSSCPVFLQGTGTCSEFSILIESSQLESSDIGNVVKPGLTSYSDGAWTVKGVGNIGGTSDNFHYTYLLASGAIDVKIRVLGFNVANPPMAGLMVRETLDPDSRHFSAVLIEKDSDSLTYAQRSYRINPGDTNQRNGYPVKGIHWLRIEKAKGNSFTAYYSEVDDPRKESDWTPIGKSVLMNSFSNDFYVGIAIGARQQDFLAVTNFTVKYYGERCKSDDECHPNSVCDDILVEDVQTECWYKPGSFEEWAEGFAIDDAANQTQCEDARVSLGLDANDYDDAFACEQFDAFKCDPESIYDIIDSMAEEADVPRTTTSVSYNDIT